MEDDKLEIMATKYNYYNFNYKRVECNGNTFYTYVKIESDDLRNSDESKLCESIYREINNTDFQKIKILHDFSSDCGNYKIDLANPNVPCNANYKNYLDNNIENYKKLQNFCGVEKNQDTHGTVFRTLFPEKNHRILPTLSCIQEKTSRRIQLLSDKCDRQLFPQEQASGHEPVAQLDQASGTFLERESVPQSDKSITRHSQIITDVTFSRKGLVGFKLDNLQTIEMTNMHLKMNIQILALEELT
ncbi:PIR Superfamily Protein [Plasmodium ovale curtisi]|uniref:PIR Superfamily Protein n=1 Tax=Plasmodium ovale curtisi TaxID=864141 RepID=A0A1A8X3R9_PLAOA|nr:PIR Superfamily Protein [Plasmodium ovale curtisi]